MKKSSENYGFSSKKLKNLLESLKLLLFLQEIF